MTVEEFFQKVFTFHIPGDNWGDHAYNMLFAYKPRMARNAVKAKLDPRGQKELPASFVTYIFEEWRVG